jgi:RNA polymerase sigma-70 factor (ECF subfamily)
MPDWTDQELCAGMIRQETREEAFRRLVRRYSPCLLGFLIRRCGGDRHFAEDLLGMTFYRAYTGLARANEPCRSLRAWLFTVAARLALDEQGCRAREARFLAGDPLDEDLPAPAGFDDEPEIRGDVAAAVERVLESLSREDPRARVLLEMEHIAGCDRGEIADATGIERRQLAQYLVRARERFRRLAAEEPDLAGLLADEQTAQAVARGRE